MSDFENLNFEDAEAKILEEAVETSYKKAGINASITDYVSKQTVKNKASEEPQVGDDHEVDLRAAMAKVPVDQPQSRKVNLRDAIGSKQSG